MAVNESFYVFCLCQPLHQLKEFKNLCVNYKNTDLQLQTLTVSKIVFECHLLKFHFLFWTTNLSVARK